MVIKSPFPDLEFPLVDLWSLVFANPGHSVLRHVPDDKVVIIDPIDKREFTFGQLRNLTIAFAQNLQANYQWRKGDCLAVFAPNCPEYTTTVLGGLAAASIISPASVGFGVDELIFQLKDSSTKALVTHDSVLDIALKAAEACSIPKKNVIVISASPSSAQKHGLTTFTSLLTSKGGKAFTPPKINVKKDLAALPYSSGTTGRPKGVRLSHYNIISNLVGITAIQSSNNNGLKAHDQRYIAILPFSHIYGLVALVLIPLLNGATTIILPRFDLIAYLELVQRYKCNTGYIVPPILTAFAKHPIIAKYDLSSLRKGGLMSAAAPLSVPLIDAVYQRLQIPVFQAFGMTEAAPATNMQTVGNWDVGKGGVGLLLPNVQSRIVDENGKDVKSGETGEIWFRGPGIFLGYHNNPKATAESLTSDGWYKTGDIARYDAATGDFYITDRLKELIKYKGYQVPPAELEGILSSNPKVADVAVLGIWDEAQQTEIPRGFIVLQPGNKPSKELEIEICKWLEGRVSHYKRLRGGISFVAEIPKNPSGKILRRVLKQQSAPAKAAL